MPTKFNNFPSAEQVYTGSDSDIQREKRLNNWVRSYSLPSMIGNAVQSAMTNNPYDRSAALRAELAQQQANSVNLPWRTKEALANELFKASPLDAVNGDGAAPGQYHYSPRTATQSAGPGAVSPVTSGNINGQDVVVPTAGNYLNGAYQSKLAGYGLGESPTVKAYNDAVYNYKSPEQRQKEASEQRQHTWAMDVAKFNAEKALQVATIQAQGRVDAAAARPAKGKSQYEAQLKADNQERAEQTKELFNAYKAAQKSGETMPFEDWQSLAPEALVINQKYRALGEQSGRMRREAAQKYQSLPPGDSNDAAAADRINALTYGPDDRPVGLGGAGSMMNDAQGGVLPHERKAIADRIAQARANHATDEQILDLAKRGGLTTAQFNAVKQELEGKAIRKAQFGDPATAANDAKPKGKVTKGKPMKGKNYANAPFKMSSGNYSMSAAQPEMASYEDPRMRAWARATAPSYRSQVEAPAAVQAPSFLDALLRSLSPQTRRYDSPIA